MTITTAANKEGKLATTVKSVPPGLLSGPNASLTIGMMAQPANAPASTQSAWLSWRRAACQKTKATDRYTIVIPSGAAIHSRPKRNERMYNPNHDPIRQAAGVHGREFT